MTPFVRYFLFFCFFLFFWFVFVFFFAKAKESQTFFSENSQNTIQNRRRKKTCYSCRLKRNLLTKENNYFYSNTIIIIVIAIIVVVAVLFFVIQYLTLLKWKSKKLEKIMFKIKVYKKQKNINQSTCSGGENNKYSIKILYLLNTCVVPLIHKMQKFVLKTLNYYSMRKIGEYNDVRYKIWNFSYMYPQRVKHFMILNGKLEKLNFYFIKMLAKCFLAIMYLWVRSTTADSFELSFHHMFAKFRMLPR